MGATGVDFEHPDVVAWMSDRQGGHSAAPWGTLNLGRHVGDDPECVDRNRANAEVRMGMPVLYLDQVHGTRVHHARPEDLHRPPPTADAVWTEFPGLGLAAQVADCLPVLLASVAAGPPRVGAAHAGWRGLRAGVLEALVRALRDDGGVAPGHLQAWLGPCIGPRRFEVGPEVREAFLEDDAEAAVAFIPVAGSDRWLADLRALATQRLKAVGVTRITASAACTVDEAARYFSYRRDGQTGRMAAIIGIRL